MYENKDMFSAVQTDSTTTGYLLQMTVIHNSRMTVNKHMRALQFTHPASLLPPTGERLHKNCKKCLKLYLSVFKADQSRTLLKGTRWEEREKDTDRKRKERKLQNEREKSKEEAQGSM